VDRSRRSGLRRSRRRSLAGLHGQVAAPSLAIDNNDIGGVVTGPRGPEAGVWVIAETKDLPTTLRKIVVTGQSGALSGAGPSGREL
jgi:hypothetical protein